MYTTTDSVFGDSYDNYDDDTTASAISTGLVCVIIFGILACIGKVLFWVWICHRCSRRERPVITESNVVVQNTTTTPAPVQIMPGQYMPQGNQYGMPQGGNQYGVPQGNQYGMPQGGNQYGMPQGNQFANPPAYYPPGSYGPPHVPVGDGAPRSVDVDPRVDVSQKKTLVQNQ